MNKMEGRGGGEGSGGEGGRGGWMEGGRDGWIAETEFFLWTNLEDGLTH